MIRTFALAAVVALAGSAASAATYILDFDGPDPSLDSSTSQVISNPNIFTDDGISWSVATSGGLGAALFDSTCPVSYGANCNDDADLSPAVQGENGVAGNVLIQQRSQSGPTPNDDAGTQFIELTLLSDVALIWTGVSAIDDGHYIFSTNLDAALGDITNTADSETGQLSFMSSVLTQGSVLTIMFNGLTDGDLNDSGAIDNLEFSVVPVPAGLPLLLGGMGVFAALRARKKKS